MKIPDPPAPVLVLHLSHGTLGVARTLGRLGVPVYAMGEEADGPISSSRYLRDSFEWSFRASPPDRSVDELLRVGRRIGEEVVLIPAADDLALLVAEHAGDLGPRFLFPRVPASLVRSFIDKGALYHLAREHGIPTPEMRVPASLEDARELAQELGFPLMLKGIDGTRLQARTGVKMVRVDSPDQLEDRFRALRDPSRPNLMLQEYIPGGDDSVWMFDGYFDEQSRCRIGFTGRKLHQYPPYRGATSLGVLEQNPRVRSLTLRFAEAVNYRGILDIGFRHDRRDDTYKLLDPNPRLGCTFRLFTGTGGMDVARALYLHQLGEPIPAAVPDAGRKWVVEDWEVLSSRVYMRNGDLTLREWIRDLRGVQECAWWAGDDPLPALRQVGTYLPRAIRWLRRRVGERPSEGMPRRPSPA